MSDSWKVRLTGTEAWKYVPGWDEFSYDDPSSHLDIGAIAETGADIVCQCRKVHPDEIRIDLMDPTGKVVHAMLIDICWDPVFECSDIDIYIDRAVKGE